MHPVSLSMNLNAILSCICTSCYACNTRIMKYRKEKKKKVSNGVSYFLVKANIRLDKEGGSLWED